MDRDENAARNILSTRGLGTVGHTGTQCTLMQATLSWDEASTFVGEILPKLATLYIKESRVCLRVRSVNKQYCLDSRSALPAGVRLANRQSILNFRLWRETFGEGERRSASARSSRHRRRVALAVEGF
jgi:hypothetical protein